MNIFFTHKNPYIASRDLDDLRVNKMILESAALLANSIAHYGGGPSDLPIAKTTGNPFRTKAWQSHPCCIWVKESSANYLWLYMYLHSLIEEMEYRRGTIHSMSRNLKVLSQGIKFIPVGKVTPPAICTPYKQISDSIKSYRMTMAYKWEHDAKIPIWTKRARPVWYTSHLVDEARATLIELPWTGLRQPLSKRIK